MNTLPDIKTNFAEWYIDVVYKAELADQSPVRGAMVIRPYGYALWEHIVARLDHRIKETGHENAQFPLFIPESFITREAKHIEGFAPELAVVTHAGGKKLEEPYVVRPTSETIIHAMFARWIKSWRDLPLKINQWANVVRWEMRPRPFLRTTEFFWQEGHTAHVTYQEAHDEAVMMLHEYIDLATTYLAIPVIAGQKSEHEKFPGAEITMTFEGIMQDGKALQMGTSHILSQSFAKTSNMQFQDKDGAMAYPFLTSWGTTTRLIGAVVMTHGDEKGLVLPPRIAPIQVIIIPILTKNADVEAIHTATTTLQAQLKKAGIRAKIDTTDRSPGAKFYHWELRGVPYKVEIGPRDLANGQATVSDRLGLCKEAVALDALVEYCTIKLDEFQTILLERATERRNALWHKEKKLSVFGPQLDQGGCFFQTGWCGKKECEELLKEYKASTRCLLKEKTFGECFACNGANQQDVIVAKSY
jgi:prolyl-tRNA synthetase